MSRVTDIIITCGVAENSAIDKLNSLFQSGTPFKEASPSAGTKALQTTILIGAFNYLDAEKLVFAIRNAGWRWPESVRLFAQSEGEYSVKLLGSFEELSEHT